MKLTGIIASLLLTLAMAATPVHCKAAGLTGELIDVLHEQGVITDSSYDELKKTAETGGDAKASARLIDLLHENGTLSDESYKRLKEKAARETPQYSPAHQPAAPLPAGDRPAEAVLGSLEEGFARLGGGDIKLKLGVWLQGGFVYDDSGTNAGALPGASTFNANSGSTSNFRFARTYFNFSFREEIGLRIMLDGTSSSSPLRDAYVWFDYIPYTRVTFGQFLTPFGSEAWRAPFENPLINYSFATTQMQFTNFRDTGLMVAPKFSAEVAGLPLAAGFATAVINGNGINVSDDNDHKDIIGRAWVEPFIPGLQIGGSWYYGKSSNTRPAVVAPPIPAGPAFDTDWQRWGAEFNYKPTFVPGLALRGEYLFQRKYYPSAMTPLTAPNRYVHSKGWYVQASYRPDFFEGSLSFANDLEAAARYEQFDEDQAVTDNERSRVTMGLNYWFNKYLRLLANYEIIRADAALNPLTGATIMPKGIDRVHHNVLTSHLQVWF